MPGVEILGDFSSSSRTCTSSQLWPASCKDNPCEEDVALTKQRGMLVVIVVVLSEQICDVAVPGMRNASRNRHSERHHPFPAAKKQMEISLCLNRPGFWLLQRPAMRDCYLLVDMDLQGNLPLPGRCN